MEKPQNELISDQKEEETVPWKSFLESYPPNRLFRVEEMAFSGTHRYIWYVSTPDLSLFCNSDSCGGMRVFSNTSDSVALGVCDWQEVFMTFTCRNCKKGVKYFAMLVYRDEDDQGEAFKIGEWPPHGARIHSHVKSLVGSSHEVFLKGRRSENQAMGIGAFSYYKRVVEEQVGSFLDQIIRVSESVQSPPEVMTQLEKAKKEKELSKMAEEINQVIPDALRMEGHDPLSLLNEALTKAEKAQSDEEYLELAKSIRVILTHLGSKIHQMLNEGADIKKTVDLLTPTQEEKT